MKRLFNFSKRILSKRIVKDIIFVVIAFVVLNILSGVIGNSAYAGSAPEWLRPIWENTRIFLHANLLIITSIISGVSILLLLIIIYRNRGLNKAINLTDNLAKLDDSLLILLANLISGHHAKSKEDLQKERQRLLYELLRDATKTVLGDTNKGRAIILFPDLSNPDGKYLKIIAYHRINPQTLARTRFYIGNDETRNDERGTVGVAYLERSMRIGNINKKDDRWECDDEHYCVFDENRIRPPYDTFVNVPIIGPPKNGDINCLGILCLDCRIPDAFNSLGTKATLEAISRRIAVVLSIYEELI